MNGATLLRGQAVRYTDAADPPPVPRAVPYIVADTSFAIVFEKALNWTRFGLWLSMLVNRHGSAILRIKGLLAVDGRTAPITIHCVQHIVHVPQHLAVWPDPHDTRSRLVFITRGLAPALIERSLASFGLLSSQHPDQQASLESRRLHLQRQ